jgi:hypothetical protein
MTTNNLLVNINLSKRVIFPAAANKMRLTAPPEVKEIALPQTFLILFMMTNAPKSYIMIT